MPICSTAPDNQGICPQSSRQLVAQTPVLAYDVPTACRVSSLSRSRIYQLIAQNKLASTTIGKRRLILASSLHDLIEKGC